MTPQKFIEYDKDLYHCIRVLWEAHKTWDFSAFFNILADDCKLSSAWLSDDIQWKEAIINYYNEKDRWDYVFYEVVRLEWNITPNPVHIKNAKDWKDARLRVMYDDGKLCLLLNILSWTNTTPREYLIRLDLNDSGLIKEISVLIPDLYCFREFILPRNFSNEDFWTDRYPKYEEDNIFNEQELCNLANMWARAMFRDTWRELKYMQPRLDKAPNIVVNNQWEDYFVVVRWFHEKDIKNWKFNENWQLISCDYTANLPDLRLRHLWKQMAEEKWLKYSILLCYFRNIDQNWDWLIRRWDKWDYDIFWLNDELDFDC